MKKETKVRIGRFLDQLQPILLGALGAIVTIQAIQFGGYPALYILIAFVLGLLVAAHFYQKKLRKVFGMLDIAIETHIKSMEAITRLLQHLQEEVGIEVQMETNDERLEDLITAFKMKGGDTDDKKTVN